VTSREPVRIPAHVEVHVHYQHAYECRQCSDQLDHSVIKKAPLPRLFITNSFASPSVLTQTMIEKFPVYRQERKGLGRRWSSPNASTDNQLAYLGMQLWLGRSL
ncbi:hypothetical protein QP475_13185, partial [Lacticaseibacillus rhamnosus]|nr:hypothetical protein [Lacticaseibacillus rhamnosus]